MIKKGNDIMTITEQIANAHSGFSLKSKDECVEYINENKGCLLYTKADLFSDEANRKRKEVLSSESAEGIYDFLGDFFSHKEFDFNDIRYREECFEYLTDIGIEPEVAILISEEIRKGRWRVWDSEYKKCVPEDFLKWAENVKYLVSRKVIFEDFIVRE